MTDAINKCSATETAACCCVDVGTVMDNTDCTASYRHLFASQDEAQAMLAQLAEKAQSVASEPCQITSSIAQNAQGFELNIDFLFCCQAETLIFQLGLR